jgi:ribosome-associated translation inhibitor RaiA
MSVITNKWNDGSGDSITIESPSFQGNQTVKISSPVQKGISKRSMQFIGKCKKDSSKQVILTVEQEASTYTYDLTLNSDNTEIAAKGGTANITAVLKTYRNGNLVSTDNVTPVLSGSATGFSISGVIVTASNRTTTVGSRRSIVVTGKYSNTFDGQTVSSTITIYQEANMASYGALEGGSLSASDIPASGGTSSTNVTNMSQTISYTSGSTRAGTVTYSKTDEITVSSLGTTVKARTKVGQVTVTYTGEGGATANKTVDIYQAENKVTNSNYNPRITAYGTPTISIGSGLTAAGGSATVSASVTNTETYNALYSSGAIGPNQTRSVGGSLSISMTVNGNSRFSLSGNTITHSSMGTNETTDTITIKAVNDGDSSKSATASKSITNSKTVKSTSGGIYTYGDVIAGTVTNGIIPASGGSATATAGNGTQSWNKSATITTYQYDSGSTKDVTTENASSGVDEVVPNVAYIEATASSKGATVSSQTTVKSQIVIWLANDKSAFRIMYIYQAANEIVSYNYTEWEIVLRANPTTIPASGGTSQLTNSAIRDRIPVYTSGATGSNTTISSIPSLSISGDGFTLANNIVTASKNNGGARSCTVTASKEGAVSQTITITQSAGPDGIGYMQIEGDGKSHPIFRVGNTTRSIEPTSVNQNSDITSDKDNSIFASLKQLLFKFI